MFDVGFMELLLVGVVALLVVGPERLPGLARTAGAWVGRARAFVGNVKADIDKELKAEELKRILDEQARLSNPLEEIVEQTRQGLGEVKKDVEQIETSLTQDARKDD
ncbi:MAG: Sec-independent protein translocase protein TatB [Gammaproteobacteria bacterium SHHR-1]|uniref:Sec-independent protein translocase protein TatB n=1 Tax=Magnetovirga frankeli TaxID=947516 RepID=UPI0012936EB8|nr:twin-arginine translocase subunit TatB [gamma proteobacterium SS-5]